MRRAFLALLLGIALQGFAAFALIAWWTREGRPRSDPPARSAAELLVADPVSTAAGGPGSPAGAPAADERAFRSRPPRAARPAGTRDAFSFRGEVKAGLAALRGRVAAAGCAAEGASFTLDLETVEGGILVAEARLEPGGSAGEESVACARSALLGETIAAPSAAPGRRWQISFAP